MLFALCLFLISQAHNITDDALVAAINDTLTDCIVILRAVREFVDEIEDFDIRRRATKNAGDLAQQVVKKMRSCGTIMDTVDNFRSQLKPPTTQLGQIVLSKKEMVYLNTLLKGESKKIGEVLYVASTYGDTASNFHSACDKQGPTVVIVETTTGNLFGGYTDISWGVARNTYHPSTKSFVFSIRPVMKQYKIRSSETSYAVYHHTSYGPTFGRPGHTIYIASGARSNRNSVTSGQSYELSGHVLNGGVKNFQVKDYVVAKASAL
jgi:regulator of replication initiation timing